MPADLSVFPKDYVEGRDRFRTAAKAAGCRLEAHAIDAKGPDGGELTIDVAFRDGSGMAQRVVIVSSGLHGAEGFFGSGIQTAWLETVGQSWQPPAGVRLIIAHALNPYGFAWRRRWDENNIDLNRNFLINRDFLSDDPKYAHSRDVYACLDPLLNLKKPPSRLEPYTLKVMLTILRQGLKARGQLPASQRPGAWALGRLFDLGLGEFKKTLPVGQYERPLGLFYGGSGPATATRIMQARLPEWVGNAAFALHIDFHTGLGRWADYKLLLDDGPDTEAARWVADKFGADVVEPIDGATAYAARGSIGQYSQWALKECRYHYFCAEFGTYSPMRVLAALRAENQAHHYGRQPGQSLEWPKRQVVETFCPASPAWRGEVLEKGLGILQRALMVTTNSV